MAPNITLALEVLRMPMLELRTYLSQQAQENPLLEMEELPEEVDVAPDEQGSSASSEERGNGLDEEWLSHWRTGGERETADTGDDSEGWSAEPSVALAQSLYESLQLQLGCQKLSEEERRLTELVIRHLDDHGYLEGSLEELAAQAGAALEQIEAALSIVQHCDPPGVGARNLRECLMIQIQLERQACDDPNPAQTREDAACVELASRILRDHFQLFVERRLQPLFKATGATPEELAAALELLKRLNPKPGRAFTGEISPSVVPDLVIRHRDNRYDVELSDQELPQVRISRTYYRMLKDPRTPPDVREFLSTKFRNASWLIKAIDERNATILATARCLISLQREFLEQGHRAIKPLTQAQVASLIGRHPSTVSRAIAGKTIDTPYGVFRLEQLFASSVPQLDVTGSVSDEEIKSELRRFIDAENPARPLSDAALAAQLKAERNITVARRTVAKYRTTLRILPAHLRKHRI